MKIGSAVRPGRVPKKARTGQDSQKVTTNINFAYMGRSPHCYDYNQNLHGGYPPGHNHICKVSSWNF